jgi:hypothetical protein
VILISLRPDNITNQITFRLGIAYKNDDEIKIVRPDSFFAELPNDRIAVDIVDPHGIYLSDALPKLQGLAR